jgi:dephospho-CoA kinase
MMIIGLTGGIGSGKTTVANLFKDLGVPIYIADLEAKKLMNTSKVLKRKLIALFGEEAYGTEGLNRAFIASEIFSNKALLDQMNAIVHSKVGKHFKRWLKKQNADYVIKESAIIFEHNMESQFDYIIVVTSSIEDRVKRVLGRDNTSKEKILSIMKHQLPDEDKIKKADFVIVNEDLQHTKTQVLKTHKSILKHVF